jgi:hypothetical protein
VSFAYRRFRQLLVPDCSIPLPAKPSKFPEKGRDDLVNEGDPASVKGSAI